MRLIIISIFIFFLFSCTKKETRNIELPSTKQEAMKIYEEALKSMEDGQYLIASERFDKSESLLPQTEWAAKSALMSSYCLYIINFYTESIAGLDRYTKQYPADKNIPYAHYLIAISLYEQILDEKKDIEPLLLADEQIDFFIKKYPNSDYAIDLKFKKGLIQNQLASKELYVARFYVSTQKWIPAINRLKIIVDKYSQTVFIEEALHRLVEIHYYLGLENEAKKYASILGYNYNTSEWFEQSYKVLNQNYKIKKINNQKSKKEKSLFKKIIEKIK